MSLLSNCYLFKYYLYTILTFVMFMIVRNLDIFETANELIYFSFFLIRSGSYDTH